MLFRPRCTSTRRRKSAASLWYHTDQLLADLTYVQEARMRGPKPTPITLSPRQQAILEQLTRRHTSPQALVRRAQVVLAAPSPANNTQLAIQLQLHRQP